MAIGQVAPAQVGERFVEAIVRRDFDALEALFTPAIRFRAVVPRAVREASDAAAARQFVAGWFGASEAIEVVAARVEEMADRLHVGYRLELTEDGVRKVVEQQAFGIVEGDRFADLALVCSGFRPLAETSAPAGRPAANARLEAAGEDCATLTPRVRAAMRELQTGQILEVVADDPAASEGLKAWSRLTGNELIGESAGDAAACSYYLRRG